MNQQVNDKLSVLEDLMVDETMQEGVKGSGISRIGILVDDDYPGSANANASPGIGVLKSIDGGRTW